MGSKDVWADLGSSPSSEPGVSLPVPCWRGDPYPESAGNLPISRGKVQSGRDSFRTWKREAQKQESKISGMVPPLFRVSDDYDWHSASFQGRNSYCKTAPDATFMHMKDDHMRNTQLKPGYNVQIAATDIFQDRNDVWTLVPFLKDMEQKLGYRYLSVTADSGYKSEEAYKYLSGAGQKPYIKPQTYEKWKKRRFKKDISKRKNMRYDEAADTYTCHAEKS